MKEKQNKIDKATESIFNIIHNLEKEIGEKVEINSYWGDIVQDGVEKEGTKILITTSSKSYKKAKNGLNKLKKYRP